MVAEAAVVGFPHPVKGEGVYAYVILKDGVCTEDTAALQQELKAQVGERGGAIITMSILLVLSLPIFPESGFP